jgi:hypothetical protein
MRDTDIDYSDLPTPDLPPLDKTFLKKATTAWPPAKKQLTIRLDADVLDWLKGHGRGYQTRINRILRGDGESTSPGSSSLGSAPGVQDSLCQRVRRTTRYC